MLCRLSQGSGAAGNETSLCHPGEWKVIREGVEGECWVIAGGLFGDSKGIEMCTNSWEH